MYRQRKTPGTQRRTGLTMAYEEQGTRRSQVAKRKRLWYECVYPQWELFIYKCVQFACNGSIEGYSVPDVICPWFGSLSHPLPLPSSPPNPPHVLLGVVVIVVVVIVVVVVVNGS